MKKHLRHTLFIVGLCLAGLMPWTGRAGDAPASAPVWIERMTWPEIAARVRGGATTVLVPTGGTEQSGPHLGLGKHSAIVARAAEMIAGRRGDILIAPVVAVVPEGSLNPPSDNLRWPGTLGVSDDTFGRMLADIAGSLALHGFRTIAFLGDHGGSQGAQTRIAQSLSKSWAGLGIRVINLTAYYEPADEVEWLAARGVPAASQGWHGGVAETAMLMAAAPDLVRADKLTPASWAGIAQPGADGDPSRATAELGRALLDRKVTAALAQLK